jgi:hypothetical protein
MFAFRHAAYDTPLWVLPNTRPGRFHLPDEGSSTQYLSLHPLGPAAERLRHELTGPDVAAADTMVLNLWAIDAEVEAVTPIGFADAAGFGLTPDELVGDDWAPTQALGARLRTSGVGAIRVPSAALPGTEVLVVFGPRVVTSYLEAPVTSDEWPTGHLSDAARAPAEVVPLVRWHGTPHGGLEAWRHSGTMPVLADPIATRR